VKFLVDHQLPPALAIFLRDHGHDAQHVRELGLKSDDDLTIWKHATTCNFILISKDEDFFHLANRADENGKLIWVRLGNCRNQPLLQAFESSLPQILDSLKEGYPIIEVR
jgi:predicted nuclease of predicted toxin-antitoxin system